MLMLVQGSLRELQSCNAYLFDRVAGEISVIYVLLDVD